MSELQFSNWDFLNTEGTVYEIYKINEDEISGYVIHALLYLQVAKEDDPESEDKVLCLPLGKIFPSAHDAFDWIQDTGPVFHNTSASVHILNEAGEIVTEWELEDSDDDAED